MFLNVTASSGLFDKAKTFEVMINTDKITHVEPALAEDHNNHCYVYLGDDNSVLVCMSLREFAALLTHAIEKTARADFEWKRERGGR
jgi:hypothetical protein